MCLGHGLTDAFAENDAVAFLNRSVRIVGTREAVGLGAVSTTCPAPSYSTSESVLYELVTLRAWDGRALLLLRNL